MPQIDQLPSVFNSQLFWLMVVFGLLYFGIARTMMQKVRSGIDTRTERIAEDLNRAQAARALAEQEEAAWTARIELARVEAVAVLRDAQRAAAREGEAKVRAALAEINARVALAEKRIRDASREIEAEMVGVAAGAAQDLVKQLTGIEVSGEEALEAVTTELQLIAGRDGGAPAVDRYAQRFVRPAQSRAEQRAEAKVS